MCEADFSYYAYYESLQKRIASQREEIRRLHNHIRNLEQSRNAWKDKAERIGKQLYDVLNERSNENAE